MTTPEPPVQPKRRQLDLAGTTAPSADPTPAPAIVAVPPPAAPAPRAAANPAARRAGRPTHQTSHTTGSLVAGLPDPRHDLVTVSFAVPREIAQAIDVLTRTTRRPKKDIIADALYEHLPEVLVAEVRAALYPRTS